MAAAADVFCFRLRFVASASRRADFTGDAVTVAAAAAAVVCRFLPDAAAAAAVAFLLYRAASAAEISA